MNAINASAGPYTNAPVIAASVLRSCTLDDSFVSASRRRTRRSDSRQDPGKRERETAQHASSCGGAAGGSCGCVGWRLRICHARSRPPALPAYAEPHDSGTPTTATAGGRQHGRRRPQQRREDQRGHRDHAGAMQISRMPSRRSRRCLLRLARPRSRRHRLPRPPPPPVALLHRQHAQHAEEHEQRPPHSEVAHGECSREGARSRGPRLPPAVHPC